MATSASGAEFSATTADSISAGAAASLDVPPKMARTMVLTAPATRDGALRQRIPSRPRLSSSGSMPSFRASTATSAGNRSAGTGSQSPGHGRA